MILKKIHQGKEKEVKYRVESVGHYSTPVDRHMCYCVKDCRTVDGQQDILEDVGMPREVQISLQGLVSSFFIMSTSSFFPLRLFFFEYFQGNNRENI